MTTTMVAIVLFILGAVCLYIGFRMSRQSELLHAYIPVDHISGIPYNVPVVVHGLITSTTPLTSPITHRPCIYYRYTLQQKVARTDKDGRTIYEWQTVGAPEEFRTSFMVELNNEKLLIRPENGHIEATIKTDKVMSPGSIDAIKSGNTLASVAGSIVSAIAGSQERVIEEIISAEGDINVFGVLSLEGGTPFIQHTKQYPLVITTKSKDQLVQSEQFKTIILYGVGILLLILGSYIYATSK